MDAVPPKYLERIERLNFVQLKEFTPPRNLLLLAHRVSLRVVVYSNWKNTARKKAPET